MSVARAVVIDLFTLFTLFTNTDLNLGNVPDPTVPLWCCGQRLEASQAMGTLADTGVMSTICRRRGITSVTVGIDTKAVALPAVLAECLQGGCDEVLGLPDDQVAGRKRERSSRREEHVGGVLVSKP